MRKNTTTETLVLTKDVKNPKPDRRRKRDWRYLPVWEKGTKFVVTTEYHERTRDKELLSAAQSVADKLIAAGEEVPEDAAHELRVLKALVDSGPHKLVLVGKRGTYDRLNASWDEAKPLMEALKPAKKDLKDVLGDYAKDSYGGPIVVLKQLVENGSLTFKQIERAVAELDPDHTVLDSIVMAADEVSE